MARTAATRPIQWAGSTKEDLRRFRFADLVYVLHVFQKKSTHGIATPKRVLDLVRERLKRAQLDHEARSKNK